MTLHNTIATMNRNLNREGFMIHNDRQPAAWPTGTQSRRAFLAAGTLFGFRMAAGAKPTAKYRVGVIGCGRKGTQHARCYDLNPLSEVVAAADIDPDNLDLFCKRFGVKGYRDYREMLRKEKIDIAAPVLPTKINPSIVLGCTEFPERTNTHMGIVKLTDCRGTKLPYRVFRRGFTTHILGLSQLVMR